MTNVKGVVIYYPVDNNKELLRSAIYGRTSGASTEYCWLSRRHGTLDSSAARNGPQPSRERNRDRQLSGYGRQTKKRACCRSLRPREATPGDDVRRRTGNLLKQIRISKRDDDQLPSTFCKSLHKVCKGLWRGCRNSIPDLSDV